MRVVGREVIRTFCVTRTKSMALFSPDRSGSQIAPLKPRHSMAGCSHLFQAGDARG
jgi:hypothetical protein